VAEGCLRLREKNLRNTLAYKGLRSPDSSHGENAVRRIVANHC
jgi:hypothetical protein